MLFIPFSKNAEITQSFQSMNIRIYSGLHFPAFGLNMERYGVLATYQLSKIHNIGIFCWLSFFFSFSFFFFFDISILIISRYLSTLTIPLSKRNQSNISSELLFLLWLFFVVISRKYKTWAIFYILMTIAMVINIINRQMNQFLQLLFKL